MMGSIHNDLHSWAASARVRGHKTIEISTEVAEKASEIIVSQANEIDDLRAAINVALVGGNHIASFLISCLGAGFSEELPAGTDPDIALRRLGATYEYEAWCAWSALIRARDIAEGASAFIEGENK